MKVTMKTAAWALGISAVAGAILMWQQNKKAAAALRQALDCAE